MLWGGASGSLEVRAEGGATHLRARFPYGQATELAPGRREVIASRAFAERIEAGAEIHLLSGHSYDRPLASTMAGNLSLRDGDDALEITAEIEDGTSWARDFLAAHRSGLIKGLSPGFRVSAGGERVEQRGDGLLRTITKAALFEVSTVTRPAYPQAQIEARCWGAATVAGDNGSPHPLYRWRI